MNRTGYSALNNASRNKKLFLCLTVMLVSFLFYGYGLQDKQTQTRCLKDILENTIKPLGKQRIITKRDLSERLKSIKDDLENCQCPESLAFKDVIKSLDQYINQVRGFRSRGNYRTRNRIFSNSLSKKISNLIREIEKSGEEEDTGSRPDSSKKKKEPSNTNERPVRYLFFFIIILAVNILAIGILYFFLRKGILHTNRYLIKSNSELSSLRESLDKIPDFSDLPDQTSKAVEKMKGAFKETGSEILSRINKLENRLEEFEKKAGKLEPSGTLNLRNIRNPFEQDKPKKGKDKK